MIIKSCLKVIVLAFIFYAVPARGEHNFMDDLPSNLRDDPRAQRLAREAQTLTNQMNNPPDEGDPVRRQEILNGYVAEANRIQRELADLVALSGAGSSSGSTSSSTSLSSSRYDSASAVSSVSKSAPYVPARRNSSAPAQIIPKRLFEGSMTSYVSGTQPNFGSVPASSAKEFKLQFSQALVDDLKVQLLDPSQKPNAPANVLRDAVNDLLKDAYSSAYQKTDPWDRVNLSATEIVTAWASGKLPRVSDASTRPIDSFANAVDDIRADAHSSDRMKGSSSSSPEGVSLSERDRWMNERRRQIEFLLEMIESKKREIESSKRDIALHPDWIDHVATCQKNIRNDQLRIQEYDAKIAGLRAELRDPPPIRN